MRLLVVGPCTSRKRYDPPNQLTRDDFRDLDRLARAERELQACPAVEMYTGLQHTLTVEAIAQLRQAGAAVDLTIVSAGYGLIAEDRVIAPYDVTFSTMRPEEATQWAAFLRIPADIRDRIAPYPLVLFLLGEKYLTAIGPPLRPGANQRLVFFARPGESRLAGAGVTIVPAGTDRCPEFRAGAVALKGAMFRALARTVATAPERWLARIHDDGSGEVVEQAMAAGCRSGR
ncbi:MAG: hypothetical protein HYY04_01545 [Chloroflexi bacterium]|nr:hypothetical protein [Chloroflexota bacterium]